MTSPASPRVTARLIRAVAALVALLAVIVGVPVVLVAIGALPHGVPSLQDVLHSLRSRDDTGEYFRIAGAGTVWIAWAVFTLATLKEVAASIRYRGPRPSLPHRGALARLAPAALVAAIAVLFVAGPPVLTITAHASAEPAPSNTVSTAHRLPDRAALAQPHRTPSAPTAAMLPTYEVRPLRHGLERRGQASARRPGRTVQGHRRAQPGPCRPGQRDQHRHRPVAAR